MVRLMNLYKFLISLLVAASMLLVAACEMEPVFTEMSTNRLKIVVKGTLESEDPVTDTFEFEPGTTSASGYSDDSVDDEPVNTTYDLMPATFMFDISEIKLNGKAIGNYRQVFSIPLSDDEPFFNGTGITLKNDDPGNGSYSTVQLYIRKMIFDNAQIYTNSGTSFIYEEAAEVIFNENKVEGFNFNNLQVNSYWDSLRDNYASVLRIYPLVIPIIGGMNYDRSNDETVLEIRIVIKNFIKMYEYDYYDDGIFKVCHFYGLSDWLRDVRADEHDMGRNIIAVARAYVPGKTGTVDVTADPGHYVIAIPATEDISDYSILYSGDTLRTTLVPNYDMPVAPVYSSAHIESVLDYYCNYEDYKYEWNNIVSTYNVFDDYCAEWQDYEDAVEYFRIAPYISMSTGTATFSNMAPGFYNFYEVTTTPGYGELFIDSDINTTPLNGLGTPAEITTGINTIP